MRGPCSTPITPLRGSLLHADPHPYLIDTGIDRVEAQVSAFESWLHGGAWNEPAPDPEYP
jgi:hypothetical protein